ncbi:MAG: arginyltransferase, partial [Gammaproteobacteria bacterium]
MISIPLIMTQEHPCSYLEGRMARSLYVHPSCQMTAGVYGNLLEQGFRRSGDDVYVPHCAHC